MFPSGIFLFGPVDNPMDAWNTPISQIQKELLERSHTPGVTRPGCHPRLGQCKLVSLLPLTEAKRPFKTHLESHPSHENRPTKLPGAPQHP